MEFIATDFSLCSLQLLLIGLVARVSISISNSSLLDYAFSLPSSQLPELQAHPQLFVIHYQHQRPATHRGPVQ